MSTIINGYRLTSDFTTANGGQCRWAFAERDGRQYFLKEFLAPTYPVPGSPGSTTTKARKLEECRQFEGWHRKLMTALAGSSKNGGNLVVAHDFFRSEARYYKVTARVDVSGMGPGRIAALPRRTQAILLTTVAHSVQILHRLDFVHGDLKPPNVLIKQTAKGLYAGKLIDFDDAYVSRRPPPAEDLVGDIAYYSPETQRYVLDRAAPTELTVAADIFALGILFTEYLTGSRPFYADGMTCATGALDGRTPTTGLETSWPAMDRLVRRMQAPAAAARPAIAAVIDSLKDIRDGGTGEPSAPKLDGSMTATPPRPGTPRRARDSRPGSLEGSLLEPRRHRPGR